jgi:hypothetical protein
MIYCVIPEALESELFEKLVAHYADDPEVTVIVDRRKSERRERGAAAPEEGRRTIRDRRRRRAVGEFPPLAGEPQ